MIRAILPLAAMLLPTCAIALDLESMSVNNRRIACVAYGLIDVQMRFDNGQLDEAVYQRERGQLIWRVQNKGDNYNYARDFRRLNAYANAIIEEQPPPDEFAAQVQACRVLLRL
jgi:hypothetical protein